MSLRTRIRNFILCCKRKSASKRIIAGTHTLDEMVLYAKSTYGAMEAKHKSGELPSGFSIYEIKIGRNCLDIEIDNTRDTFGVSFSGSKKAMKRLKKTAKDLYFYYGVSENDIINRTERYLSLLGVLSL